MTIKGVIWMTMMILCHSQSKNCFTCNFPEPEICCFSGGCHSLQVVSLLGNPHTHTHKTKNCQASFEMIELTRECKVYFRRILSWGRDWVCCIFCSTSDCVSSFKASLKQQSKEEIARQSSVYNTTVYVGNLPINCTGKIF